MKYIIVRDEHGAEFPVFCLAPQTHAQLARAWRQDGQTRVVSAGFVEFLPTGIRTFGHSEGLKIYPRARDAEFIAAFYRATLAAASAAQPSALQHAADVALHRTA